MRRQSIESLVKLEEVLVVEWVFLAFHKVLVVRYGRE